MPNAKRASKGKRLSKAVPVLGIAGVSLSMAGGADRIGGECAVAEYATASGHHSR
jgi:hypothetical protein